MDETLNVLQEEKPAVSVEELTSLVPSMKQRKQPNLPNLDVEGIQKERIRRETHVRYVESEGGEDEYAFAVNSAAPPEKINVTVGGVVVAVLIYSGASTNVIDKNLWLKLKQEKIKCVSKKSNKKLYTYGGDQPLKVLRTLSASVKAGQNQLEAGKLQCSIYLRLCYTS